MATAGNKAPPKPPAEIVKKEGKKESTPVKEVKRDAKESANHGGGRHEERNEQHGRRDRQSDSRQGDRFQGRRGGRGHPYGGQGRGGYRGQGNRDSSNQQREGGGGFQHQQGFQQEEGPPVFTIDDTPKEPKKFTGRCRLFVGNITPDTTEEQFKEMFTPYGEVSEVFVNAAKGFGFIRLVRRNK